MKHYLAETKTLDPEQTYRVAGWSGIAFRYLGDEAEPDGDTQWTGIYEPTGRVLMVMIGDGRVWTIDPEDVTPINEDDYCPECGQIGCTALKWGCQ